MTPITLILEDDEMFYLRGFMRQMELLLPDMADSRDETAFHTLMKKVIDATVDVSPEWRREIGKMQRAIRKIRGTPEYAEMLGAMQVLTNKMQEEMAKEDKDRFNGLGEFPAQE